jgi:DNA-binding MarR family transcriptional regulator
LIFKKSSTKTEETQGASIWLSESLMGRVGFLLNKSAQVIRENYEEKLKPLGLMPKHYRVMAALEEKGSISQQEIGKCIYVDRTTMVGIIDDLEKAGLVERKEHPTDRRSHSVYLTAKGKEALPKAHHLGMEVEKRFLECLSAKEQKELVRLLRQLVVVHYTAAKEKV